MGPIDLLLSASERQRFAAYLEREAATTQGLIIEMQKLGGPLEGLIRARKAEATAQQIVARMLRAVEEQTL